MPKSLSVISIRDKNAISSVNAWVSLLAVTVKDPLTAQIIETIYLANNTEDLTFQGQIYVATRFDLELKESAGEQATVSVKVLDYTQAIQARLQAYGGIVGSDVKLIIVNAGNLNQPAEIVENFKIIGTSAANYEVTWELGAENALALPFPRRRQFRDRCSFQYKSVECGYVGGLTSCDLSLQGSNGCAAHANSINFGGFPGLNTGGVRYA
jgi:phage-related protein